MSMFVFTFWETVIVVINDKNSSEVLSFFIVLIYSLGLILAGALVSFVMFHLYLIASNHTTIEYCEKKKEIHSEYNYSPFKLSF